MRKAFTFLSAALGLALALSATAQQAPDAFKDMDKTHWAYDALESLRSKNILIGYPDGLYRGRRTLTRYELAVALDRLLKSLPPGGVGPTGPQGPAGANGDTGPAGPEGGPGMTPEEVATLKRLVDEFKGELAMLGNNINAINARLDKLSADVADLTKRVDAIPVISGRVFTGFRSDNVNGGYVDYDGRVTPLGNNQAVIHNFDLGFHKKLAGGSSVGATIRAGNYVNYVGGDTAVIAKGAGGLSSAVPTAVALSELQLTSPISFLSTNSNLTVGRFNDRMSPLTFWKPQTDRYFMVPGVSGGDYQIDGARVNAHFGSLGVQLVGAQISSVQDTSFNNFDQPVAGATGYAIFGQGGPNNKPIGQPAQGQMAVDQLIGLSISTPLHFLHGGEISASGLELANRGTAPVGGGETGVWDLGAEGNLKVTSNIGVRVGFAKSINHVGKSKNFGPNIDNTAQNAMVTFGSGKLHLGAGYRYIDPLFSNPGYWGHIGNWLNPTNIQGPVLNAGFDMSSMLSFHAGAEFYSPARNRAGAGSLGGGDQINRMTAGVDFNLTKKFSTGIDWEGVYWKLVGTHGGTIPSNAGTFHPVEQYVTIGTGYRLSDNSMVKLAYQIGDFNGHGTLNEGSTGLTNNSGVFTAQATTHF